MGKGLPIFLACLGYRSRKTGTHVLNGGTNRLEKSVLSSKGQVLLNLIHKRIVFSATRIPSIDKVKVEAECR
jgi:hypothetical protein